MPLSINSVDLKTRELTGKYTGRAGNITTGSFSDALARAYQSSGGSDFEDYFRIAAETYQIPENLLKAVAKAESDFNPNAVSSCGAQGVMQLMPSTARALGVSNSFDPAQNIMGGAKYLRQQLDTFDGDVSKALAAYNAGPGAVKKYDGIPPYRETQNYVTKVLSYAGNDVTVPSMGLTDTPSETESPEILTSDDLASLIMMAYSSDGISPQERAQVLVQQLLAQSEKEKEDEDQTIPPLQMFV